VDSPEAERAGRAGGRRRGQGKVVPLSTAIALSAADFSAEYSLSFADSVIYATARFHNALLISSDAHFEGLPDVKFFSKKN
jgi:predicted nucleic acid-binding protein